MNKLFTSIGLAVFSLAAFINPLSAQTLAQVNLFTGNVTNVTGAIGVTNKITVSRITVSSLNNVGVAGTLFFYDWPHTTLLVTNTVAYTNTVIIPNVVFSNVVVNSVGRLQTNRYFGQMTSNFVVAANSTVPVPPIAAITVSPGSFFTLDVDWVVANHLMARGTNYTGTNTIIFQYK